MLIELFKNKININPPNNARGTVSIIINGCIKELKVAGFRDHKLSSLFATVLTHLVEMIVQDSTG